MGMNLVSLVLGNTQVMCKGWNAVASFLSQGDLMCQLILEGMKEIPPSLILKRWMKATREDIGLELGKPPKMDAGLECARFLALSGDCRTLCSCGAKILEGYSFLEKEKEKKKNRLSENTLKYEERIWGKRRLSKAIGTRTS